MGKFIDMTGKKCGKLVVIERAPNKDGRAMWKCKCDCGNEVIVSGKYLRNSHTISCGHCGRPDKIINETGNRYGHLVVLGPAESQNGRAAWKCRCDCGTEIEVTGQQLRRGNVVTCGKKCKNLDRLKNEIGNKYGNLTVIELASRANGGPVMWKCLCDCGSETIVAANHLRNGHTTSCGCMGSKGESAIIKLLNAENIKYQTQKTFDTCRFPGTNSLAKFDFYVDNRYLIEYDGEQHFNYRSKGWNDKEKFEKTQCRDAFKNQWCKENNIPLIRIPYTRLKDLCIEDLMVETSHFIKEV